MGCVVHSYPEKSMNRRLPEATAVTALVAAACCLLLPLSLAAAGSTLLFVVDPLLLLAAAGLGLLVAVILSRRLKRERP